MIVVDVFLHPSEQYLWRGRMKVLPQPGDAMRFTKRQRDLLSACGVSRDLIVHVVARWTPDWADIHLRVSQ